ncbi:MAG TPA: HIT family protein [Saprospiraceae bacterium]|jgi:histidine triad (HIT) family protein|nr:HIT family protein [Saprospiraceae bacterium]HRO08036.1 HIT family protein [Saprospiraceae bacterium]HRO72086.1 HIT family protein [Saprospiraceae bacterium]HRP41377.1 HIT family protein [Saprospiraceae bacterium]
MSTIFTKIINREVPAYIIAEDERFLAFLDAFPLVKGHTLVVPKQELDYIFDIEDDLLADLHIFAKQVAIAMKKAIPCTRIGMTVIGLEVPHTHIHLIPINQVSDMNFAKSKIQLSPEEMISVASEIKAYL